MKMKIFIFIIVFIFNDYYTDGNVVNKEIIKSYLWMNEDADPCEDFLNFTCGGFSNSNEIPEGRDHINVFQNPKEAFKKQLKSLLEEPEHDEDLKALNSVKIYYKACTNIQKIETSSLHDLKNLVDKLGGWPLIDSNWHELEYDWAKVHYKMTDIGVDVDIFIDIDVTIDNDDKTIHRIKVQRMYLGQTDYILRKGMDDPDVKKYMKYMTEMAVLFGAKDNVEKDMEDVLDIEIKLAEAGLQNYEENVQMRKYTISELQTEFPNVPWLEYLTKILMDTVTLDNSELVIVGQPKYLGMVNTILGETPKRILANFQMWHVVRPLIYTLNLNARRKKSGFFYEGEYNELGRSSYCLREIKTNLPVLLSSLYVRKYADARSKEIVAEMADLLTNEFKTSLDGNEWLDEVTKSAAVKKTKELKILISYSDDLLDDKKITEEFKHLHLEEDNFLYTNINISRFNNFLEYTELRKPVQENKRFDYDIAAAVTGGYDSLKNSLVCPAGLLHHEDNFFDKSQPMYMNFGRLGTVLARGLTKYFYGEGRHFDIEGEMHDWWSNQTLNDFHAKAKCIKDQFKQFTEDNNMEKYVDKLDNEYYISAAIAGQQHAYRAYKKWLIQHNNTEYRPNKRYSNEQLFWINAGQISCYKTSNPLSNVINMFTSLATIGNTQEFSKDWKCPSGSTMNLLPKCNIW